METTLPEGVLFVRLTLVVVQKQVYAKRDLTSGEPAKYACHFSSKLTNFMHISNSINAMYGRKEIENFNPSLCAGERKIS